MSVAWSTRIESDPQILHGKPCIRGTRIPVALILGYLAAGKTRAEVLAEFPDLVELDISAALDLARELADFDAVGTP